MQKEIGRTVLPLFVSLSIMFPSLNKNTLTKMAICLKQMDISGGYLKLTLALARWVTAVEIVSDNYSIVFVIN